MKNKWVYLQKSGNFEELGKKFQVHPAIIKILADRGVRTEEEIREYLEADIQKVSNGNELTDMSKAVDIIAEAIERHKIIRVMGDYDVDGVTSTYILMAGIKRLGGLVSHFIPHRIKDGYGLHDDAIEQAFKDNVDVILTCDNGISCADTIGLARALGLTVVVTDHHEVPFEENTPDTGTFVNEAEGAAKVRDVFHKVIDEARRLTNGTGTANDAKEAMIRVAKENRLAPVYSYKENRKYIIPPANAVVDPKRPEDNVFKEICGAVVAYKFMWLLYKKFDKEKDFFDSDALEFASLGTVCDVMELQHENRAIVKAGLKACAKTSNIGLKALLEVLGLTGAELKGYDYGFKIGPCINAEGRLDTANEAFKLFCETDYNKALLMAEKMKALNIERQELTRLGMEQAFKIVDEEMINDKVLVVYLPDCHESIAGIIAGKVRERYNKPAIVLTNADAEGVLKGSGRSIEAYSMYEKLAECKDLMLGFGGHPLAAGLSLKAENLNAFRENLNKKSGLTEEDFIAKVAIDVILPVDFLSQSFIKQLEILEPFGKGNEKPVFAQKHVKALSANIIGKNKNVLKIKLNSQTCKDGVCFHDIESKNEFINAHLSDFNMLYYPTLNEWNNRISIQANISDVC